MSGSELSIALKLLLSAFLFPPGGPLLLLLLGIALWSRRRVASVLVASGSLLLYLFSTPAVHAALFSWLEAPIPLIEQAESSALSERAEAIVVLAGGRRRGMREFNDDKRGDSVNSLSLERARYGAYLQRQTGLPLLLAGGSVSNSDELAEAELMRRVIEQEWQIPVRWIESNSRTTFDNAVNSAKLLREAEVESILLVTHRWHMARALGAFDGLGLKVIPAPTAGESPSRSIYRDLYSWLPHSSVMSENSIALHELVGGLWYRLRSRWSW